MALDLNSEGKGMGQRGVWGRKTGEEWIWVKLRGFFELVVCFQTKKTEK